MTIKKRIFLISDAFYPENSPRSYRATELAKALHEQGHDITILTKFRNYDYSQFLAEHQFKLTMLQKPFLPGVPEINLRPFYFILRGFRRMLTLLFEYPDIEGMYWVRKSLRNSARFDLMISFAIPDYVHWGVAWARQKDLIAKTWIADCGDPYMFARLDRFRKPFYFKYLEMMFCRRCDYISVPFFEMQKQFYPQFISKIKVIPQGFNFKEVKVCKERPSSNAILFVFAGSVIPGKRDLTQLLNFLVTVEYDFVFRIYTKQKDLFQKYKSLMGEKLEIYDYIDRLSLICEMSKCDFLVNVDSSLDDQGNVEAVPSKLIDYALSGRPILNINSSRLEEDKVMAFLKKDYTRQRIIDLSKHNIIKVSAQFLELAE
jgi:glycosyltransferase involved in cell wall biosynthesis